MVLKVRIKCCVNPLEKTIDFAGVGNRSVKGQQVSQCLNKDTCYMENDCVSKKVYQGAFDAVSLKHWFPRIILPLSQ